MQPISRSAIVARRDAGVSLIFVTCLLLAFSRPVAADRVLPTPQSATTQILSPDAHPGVDVEAASGVRISSLSHAQIFHLELLARVWGFLKYHHRSVTSGHRNWDAELIRILPDALAAQSRSEIQHLMVRWISELGKVAQCDHCASELSGDLQLRPRLDWIDDGTYLGTELSTLLKAIHKQRAVDAQFYVSRRPAGNANFESELPFTRIQLPDSGFQLLALFRFWNAVEYWFPYRDLIEEDWGGVLREFLPRLALAESRDAYALELMQLVARVNDSHANVWNAVHLRPPQGPCSYPVKLRWVEDQPTVVGYLGEKSEAVLRAGDVVASIDGRDIDPLIASWKSFYGASNDSSLYRDLMRVALRGPCGEATLGVIRSGQRLDLKLLRIPVSSRDQQSLNSNEVAGDTFQSWSDDIAYVKMSEIRKELIPKFIERAADTKAIIIDLRSYPGDFIVFALGSLLIETETPFVVFSRPDLSNPGAFQWLPPTRLTPSRPVYRGKVVILVDEQTQSQAEYTAMALRASRNAVIVGGQTAGADGNVSFIRLPGGFNASFTGLGVFDPDRGPTQRVGIVPDISAHPTVKGIVEGRDEVVEQALRVITNPESLETLKSQ